MFKLTGNTLLTSVLQRHAVPEALTSTTTAQQSFTLLIVISTVMRGSRRGYNLRLFVSPTLFGELLGNKSYRPR